jgi:hypothetical protein
MKILALLISVSVSLSKCQKGSDSKLSTPSKMEMLTDKQWVYTEIYTNATAHKQGTLVYKRSARNNLENRDNTRAFFWRDGTFDEVGGTIVDHTKMNWAFSNSDSTEYQMIWNTGNTNVMIIKLDANNFEWYNPTQKMSGVMISRL